jgi:hypothetical protein
MARSTNRIEVYLEIGSKRTFAGALDWPGWCRAGRDEDSALQALAEAGPHYGRVVRTARLGFKAPGDISAFSVVERLKGSAATDFGVPDKIPDADARPVSDAELKRLQSILRACWRALDAAAETARGKTLRSGPRGGGRGLDKMLDHVRDAEKGYLSSLGGKAPSTTEEVRQAVLETLAASAHGEIDEVGPRGGKRWRPRYFVRREAWHVLDHVWEIEDRLEP